MKTSVICLCEYLFTIFPQSLLTSKSSEKGPQCAHGQGAPCCFPPAAPCVPRVLPSLRAAVFGHRPFCLASICQELPLVNGSSFPLKNSSLVLVFTRSSNLALSNSKNAKGFLWLTSCICSELSSRDLFFFSFEGSNGFRVNSLFVT